jgi:hypothetical protein
VLGERDRCAIGWVARGWGVATPLDLGPPVSEERKGRRLCLPCPPFAQPFPCFVMWFVDRWGPRAVNVN